ncbi:TIGR01459 family HAD-type hydrolase [Alphaproteobacteria bacterium]|nr:TIGR01459 family HAD-type hydrolase [Alphaproteobacteria bacterium]
MNGIKNFNVLSSFSEVVNNYDAFIIDIWGVLWDGIEPYKHSVDSLKNLVNLNKHIILLSNAPRRSKVVSKRLADIGIDSSYYHKIISSGEICRLNFLTNRELLNKLGYTYYFIGQEQDRTITESLDIEETSNIKKANFILVCGTRNFEDTLDDYVKELDLALSFKIPLICANPDKVVIRKTGELLLCAGAMASYYTKHGGKVFQYGKPFVRTYQLCFNYLTQKNINISKKRILCIGDALETDILGANKFGLESLLITSGIHKNQLHIKGDIIPEKTLRNFFNKEKIIPDYVLKEFIF